MRMISELSPRECLSLKVMVCFRLVMAMKA